ncbi:hypothetical protein [Chitinophaga sp. sic0106]|uniref:hypothetical protein n=1 Tax=Chitinophaga sp. sic0106 TaxID=2854785 RepID=UPI001C46A5C5|nr:hypothetical protein [Chitinophaga sp. sic0106]MBV7532799.1 hypothetical protein [Chitinophaga sp. sic0106]
MIETKPPTNYYTEVHKISKLLASQISLDIIIEQSLLVPDDTRLVIQRINVNCPSDQMIKAELPVSTSSRGFRRTRILVRIFLAFLLTMVIALELFKNSGMTLFYLSLIGIMEVAIRIFCRDEIPPTPKSLFLDRLAEEIELKNN